MSENSAISPTEQTSNEPRRELDSPIAPDRSRALLAAAGLGTREIPDHETEYRKHQHENDPKRFGSVRFAALKNVENRPDISDQDQYPE